MNSPPNAKCHQTQCLNGGTSFCCPGCLVEACLCLSAFTGEVCETPFSQQTAAIATFSGVACGLLCLVSVYILVCCWGVPRHEPPGLDL